MNVRPCMERLGITDAVLERKAEELLRKMQVKLPTLGKKHEACRPAIAVWLASRLLGQPVVAWDAAVLASTAKGKAFKELVARVESELDLKLHYHTFDQLAVKFGGEGVAEQAKKQFEFYKKAVLESVQARQREHLDFEKPVYTAAAFYYAARQLKVKLDKKALCSVTAASESELNSIVNDMLEKCGFAGTGKPGFQGDEGHADGPYSAPKSLSSSKKRQRYEAPGSEDAPRSLSQSSSSSAFKSPPMLGPFPTGRDLLSGGSGPDSARWNKGRMNRPEVVKKGPVAPRPKDEYLAFDSEEDRQLFQTWKAAVLTKANWDMSNYNHHPVPEDDRLG